MVICKAHEVLRNEAYTVRRSDEGRVQRRRWPFLDSLLALVHVFEEGPGRLLVGPEHGDDEHDRQGAE